MAETKAEEIGGQRSGLGQDQEKKGQKDRITKVERGERERELSKWGRASE